MAAKVGQVTIDLEANTAKFEQDMKKVTRSFESALNPTAKLANEIKLLEQAGKSGADIWKVYGERMNSLSDHARKHGLAIDPVISKYTQWHSGIEKLSQSLQDFARNPLQAVQAGAASLVASLGPIGIGFAAVGIAAGLAGKKLFDVVNAASENVEKLQNLSTQTGVTTQDLQALALIEKNAGMEGIDLGRAVGRLNAELGKGKGDFVDALKRLGVNLKDVSGKSKDGITLLSELGVKLKGMGNAAEIAQKGAAILGPRLTYLIPLFTQGTQSIREQMDAIKSLDGVYDETAKAGLMRFDRAMDAVNTVMETSKVQTISFLASFLDSPKAISVFAGAMVSPIIAFYRLGAAISSVHETWIRWQIAVAKFTPGLGGAVSALETKLGGVMADTYEWNKKLNSLVDVILEVGKAAYDGGSKVKTNFNPAIDDAAKALAKLNAALAESRIRAFIDDLLSSGDELRKLSANFQLVTDPSKALADNMLFVDYNLGQSIARMGEFEDAGVDAFAGINAAMQDMMALEEKPGEEAWARDWIDNVKGIESANNDLGRAFSTTLTNMTQTIAEKLTRWAGPFRDFAKAALSALMEGLFNPLTKLLTGIGNALGNWLSGLLGGGGGGGLLDGIKGALGLGAKLAGGAALSAGTAAAAGTAAEAFGTSGMIAGMSGVSTSTAAGVGASTGIGASLAGIGSTLSSILIAVAPFAEVAGMVIGAYYGVKALVGWAQGPNSWEAMSKEISRDYGGLKISDKTAAAFAKQLGITESEAWSDRKAITSSPQFLMYGYQQAQEQGKLGKYLASLGNLERSGVGKADYLTPFKMGLQSGDWSALNSLWSSAPGMAKLGAKATGGLSSLYLPSGSTTASVKAQTAQGPHIVNVKTGDSRININIYGAGHDLVSRVRSEVIPLLKQHLSGGSTGLAEAVTMAVKRTQGAF